MAPSKTCPGFLKELVTYTWKIRLTFVSSFPRNQRPSYDFFNQVNHSLSGRNHGHWKNNANGRLLPGGGLQVGLSLKGEVFGDAYVLVRDWLWHRIFAILVKKKGESNNGWVSNWASTLGMLPCSGGGTWVSQWSQELCRLRLKPLAGSTLPDWWRKTAPGPPCWGLGVGLQKPWNWVGKIIYFGLKTKCWETLAEEKMSGLTAWTSKYKLSTTPAWCCFSSDFALGNISENVPGIWCRIW